MEKVNFFVLLVFIISTFIACKTLPAENINIEEGPKNFEPITINGEMSEITLAFTKRQNYINSYGRNVVHPDGIVFYFVIVPLGDNSSKIPTLQGSSDFRINGTSYREITRRNGVDDIQPAIIFYGERTFQEDEFYERVNFESSIGLLFIKIIIFGTSIPDNGVINMVLKFGFDNEVEEFNYQFNVDSIEK
jgi:hypothetical protein